MSLNAHLTVLQQRHSALDNEIQAAQQSKPAISDAELKEMKTQEVASEGRDREAARRLGSTLRTTPVGKSGKSRTAGTPVQKFAACPGSGSLPVRRRPASALLGADLLAECRDIDGIRPVNVTRPFRLRIETIPVRIADHVEVWDFAVPWTTRVEQHDVVQPALFPVSHPTIITPIPKGNDCQRQCEVAAKRDHVADLAPVRPDQMDTDGTLAERRLPGSSMQADEIGDADQETDEIGRAENRPPRAPSPRDAICRRRARRPIRSPSGTTMSIR